MSRVPGSFLGQGPHGLVCRFIAGHKDLSDWLFATLVSGFGLPLSFLLWHLSLYRAAISDGAWKRAKSHTIAVFGYNEDSKFESKRNSKLPGHAENGHSLVHPTPGVRMRMRAALVAATASNDCLLLNL